MRVDRNRLEMTNIMELAFNLVAVSGNEMQCVKCLIHWMVGFKKTQTLKTKEKISEFENSVIENRMTQMITGRRRG